VAPRQSKSPRSPKPTLIVYDPTTVTLTDRVEIVARLKQAAAELEGQARNQAGKLGQSGGS
jgi:hypothetical protein